MRSTRRPRQLGRHGAVDGLGRPRRGRHLADVLHGAEHQPAGTPCATSRSAWRSPRTSRRGAAWATCRSSRPTRLVPDARGGRQRDLARPVRLPRPKAVAHADHRPRPGRAAPDDGILGHAPRRHASRGSSSRRSPRRRGFGQLEVPQVRQVDGQWLLVFTCHPEEQSEDQRLAFGGYCTWFVAGESPLGPFDLARPSRSRPTRSCSPRRWCRNATASGCSSASATPEPEGVLNFHIIDPLPLRRVKPLLRKWPRAKWCRGTLAME